MGRLFGTDGVRGVANTELSCEIAMAIGRAAAAVLKKETGRAKFLIGCDTRVSGDMLASAVAAGLTSVGADVILLGVVPTPAVAYLVKEMQADAGVMISASHNPAEHNGIKIFRGDGYKLPDLLEEEIESLVLDGGIFDRPTGGDIGRITVKEDARKLYISHLASTAETPLRGLKIALDCANGSASATAEALFTTLGAEVHMLSNA
ncbi:MAG: phosphoglucosamine mutase, partial [Clostridia bacterium]|nr:phosphoglucosamine mutase [Clostridia bacterium]